MGRATSGHYLAEAAFGARSVDGFFTIIYRLVDTVKFRVGGIKVVLKIVSLACRISFQSLGKFSKESGME